MEKAKVRSWLRKLRKWSLYTLFLLVSVTFIMEIAYRFQWIDFYSNELAGLNLPEDLNENHGKEKTVLVMGDSFTADPNSYIKTLREQLPDYRIINSAVPGTGIYEASLMAPGRIAEFQPDVFVYQVYEGNDLIDITHPINWSELSFARNCYWWLSDRILWFRYLNYKMAQVSANVGEELDDGSAKETGPFEPAAYSKRQQLYFRANPTILSDCRNLENGRETDMEDLKKHLQEILGLLPEGCKVKIVYIQHGAFNDPAYMRNMEVLGAQFPGGKTESKMLAALLNVAASNPDYNVLQASAYFEAGMPVRSTFQPMIYYPNDPHITDFAHIQLGMGISKEIAND